MLRLSGDRGSTTPSDDVTHTDTALPRNDAELTRHGGRSPVCGRAPASYRTICIVVWKMVKTVQCAGVYCGILGLRTSQGDNDNVESEQHTATSSLEDSG